MWCALRFTPRKWVTLSLAPFCLWSCASSGERALPTIVPNDNLVAMQTRRTGDTVVVQLDVTRGRWFPAGEHDSSLVVAAFSASKRAPSIPGPLVRATRGSLIQLAVRNDTRDTVVICPLGEISCNARNGLTLLPAAKGTLPPRQLAAGATLYRGGVLRNNAVLMSGGNAILSGAIMIDSAPPDTRERILVLNGWVDVADTNRFVQSINGRTWPATERLSASVGDTLRWQLLNATPVEHPMHLHGFYFRIESRGDITRDTSITSDERELAVTENLREWGVASIAWSPSRGGNWLFHCHKASHMSGDQLLALRNAKGASLSPEVDGAAHLMHDMSGLVLGVTVRGDPRADVASTPSPSRRLRLEMVEHPNFYRGKESGFVFRLAADTRRSLGAGVEGVPGPLLSLRRGEPVEIAIVNRLTVPSAVHWHGIELESYYDGVAGWSGIPGSLAPMLAPRDSFVARFTPRRSGSFMYHAHVRETVQITSGLYAPIVVTDDGEPPANDHMFVFSQYGPDDLAKVAVNGQVTVDTLRVRANTMQRFRFANITANDEVSGELRDGSVVEEWRRVAKDGADLPLARQRAEVARFHFGPGEIIDVGVSLRAGRHVLHIRSFNDFDIPIVAR